tara:strand:- start:169 stop:678 length:510 start_codon:yes stop_codon:yes gene_type:complete
MKKFIFTSLLFSMVQSQDRMILNTGEEITLSKKNILEYYNLNYQIIKDENKIYQKKNIAKIINEDSVIVFRSGMLISYYNSLQLIDKARADAKTSSKNFKNMNYELLNETSKDDNRTYENLFYSYFKNREEKNLIFKRSLNYIKYSAGLGAVLFFVLLINTVYDLQGHL